LNNFKFEQFLKEVIALVVQQLVNNVHFHTTTCKLCWGGTKTCLICAKLVQTHIVLTRGVDFLQKYPYNFIRLTLVTLVLTNPYKSTCLLDGPAGSPRFFMRPANSFLICFSVAFMY
jgi:hypothetical protein